jgi:hypothetical protein
MELNNLIFPRTNSSYNFDDYKGEIVFIPKDLSLQIDCSIYYRQLEYLPNPEKLIKNKWREKVEEKGQTEIEDIDEDSEVKRLPGNIKDVKFIQTLNREKRDYIPCMFFPYQHSNNLLIYYHANSEDLGQCYNICFNISRFLKVSYF